tara:strand:- start:83 stop:406 length:324 start_codon:yes stop_codon:yes gene_type:complete
MQHKGKILEKAVRQSGMPLTKLSKKMDKSRRWMYNAFENENLSIDYILEIGNIIHYDFSEDLSDLKKYKEVADHFGSTPNLNQGDYWKNKYLILLEKYNQLLESKLN